MLKFFMLFMFLSLSATASVGIVRSLDLHDGKYEITLWTDNRVFRLSENHPQVPCIENAFKANMPVDLKLNEKGKIVNCRLARLAHPGKRTAR
ncbi:MAG TPA: hypothetical protein VNJ08_01500 [Bacteriovoracaceae bacterium]|nr:hypothetical protein [Bacteriovoracaceae bacterium]